MSPDLKFSSLLKDTRAICCYNGYGYAVVDVRFFHQVILRLVHWLPPGDVTPFVRQPYSLS